MPLPPGLSINRATGLISGTPTTAGTYTTTLRVRDAQSQSRDIPISITIDAYTAPSLSGTLSTFSTRTLAYTGQLVRAGGTAPFVWSISSGTLPTGITINATTGALSGTPTDTAYTNRALTVRVADALGGTAQHSYTLLYVNLLSYPSSYPAGQQGVAYSHIPAVVGGHAPLAFSYSGALPPGLTFDTTNGRLTGTPTTIGSYAVTFTVTDVFLTTSSISPTLSITSAYVPVDLTGTITSNSSSFNSSAPAHTFSPNYAGVGATGGNAPITYSWARTSGSTLLSAASPTALNTGFTGSIDPGTNASAVFRVTGTDGTSSDFIDVTITITNSYQLPQMSTENSPTFAMRTRSFANLFTANFGRSPYSWSLALGTLPTGISVNATTGNISGTPTDTSYTDRTYTLRLTDDELQQDNEVYVMQYKDNLTNTAGSYPGGTVGVAYTGQSTAALGYGTYTYARLIQGSNALPTGLSLNAATGAITGTPTVAGSYTFTIRATDLRGFTADSDPQVVVIV